MKLMILTNAYPSYLADYYSSRPDLCKSSFAEQKAALDFDAFAWADSWSIALVPFGYEVLEITPNAEYLQKAWCTENGLPFDPSPDGLRKTVLEQAYKFKPDIVWFNDYDVKLLDLLRGNLPSLRLVLGWVGSAIPHTDIWRRMQLILSCAPEAVSTMQERGFPAIHFPHSFDTRINDRLECRPKKFEVSFSGHLMRTRQFHLQRDNLLEQLANSTPLHVFSPTATSGMKSEVKEILKFGLFGGMKTLRAFGFPNSFLQKLPIVGCVADWSPGDINSINPKLKPLLKPGVFGLKMYQVLRDSLLSLNIHADSSPLFASNMRLYETTGVGTCLVTDWKKNIHEIFEPDKEVVVYKNADECREKINWLLNNPNEAEKIGRAGQKRTLDKYTYVHRARMLHELIGKALR